MPNHRFLLVDASSDPRPRNRVRPMVLNVPDAAGTLDRARAREFAMYATKSCEVSHPFVICEHDMDKSPEIRAMFGAVDWACVEEVGIEPPKTPQEAYNYVRMVGGPVPEVESVIATSPSLAYQYAVDILCKPFPAGEETISRDPLKSLNYSVVLGCRIRPAEDKFAGDETFATSYGVAMGRHKLWESWKEDELARSPAWMYQYAKDHLKGPLPGNLHNRMYLMSVADPSNKWIKKYFGAKKYRSKGR